MFLRFKRKIKDREARGLIQISNVLSMNIEKNSEVRLYVHDGNSVIDIHPSDDIEICNEFLEGWTRISFHKLSDWINQDKYISREEEF